MREIAASDVSPATNLLPELSYEASVGEILRKPVEALSDSPGRWVSCTDAHPLAQAAHDAFYGHYPLVLSPDMVWFCLAQGLAHHVALNAEALRGRLVRHEGRQTLEVLRNDFVLGQPNPWPEVFDGFSDQIAGRVGRLRDLVVAEFSTTGPVQRAAFQLALMETFQPYFEYLLRFGCGIPRITLLGTPEDWRSVRQRAGWFAELSVSGADLGPWLGALLPALDRIVRTAEGEDEREWWTSFFRYESASGVDELTGWIHVLFPYLRADAGGTLEPNPFLATWSDGIHTARTRRGLSWGGAEGPGLGRIPSGLVSVPLTSVDLRDGKRYPLRLIGGLFGTRQDPVSLSLVPEFGWAVVHDADGEARAPRPRPRPWRSPAPPLDVEARRLLDAVLAAPDDDAPRRAHAALLERLGDPRAELVVRQLGGDPAWDLASQCVPEGLSFDEVAFDRGYVSSLWLTAARLFRDIDLEDLLSREPIVALAISGLDRDGARWLGELTCLGRIERLDLDEHTLGPAGARVLGASLGGFGGLTGLSMGGPLGDEGVAVLAALPAVARLRRLALSHAELGPEGIGALEASPHLGGLQALGLQGLDETCVGVFAASERFPRLAEVDLGHGRVGAAGAAAIGRAPWARTVTRLALTNSALGDAGAATLAASEALSGLTHLELRRNGIGPDGARALATSPHLAGLVRLGLRGNPLGPEGEALLRSSPWLRATAIHC